MAINTHLYTSTEKLDDFPGRILVVEKVGKANDFKNTAANVVVKNYPSKSEEIRKKYNIKESKDSFLYACTLADYKKVLIAAKRIN